MSGPGPGRLRSMLEDRRRASERSIPPWISGGLLASLGYLLADGDGVCEPQLEQQQLCEAAREKASAELPRTDTTLEAHTRALPAPGLSLFGTRTKSLQSSHLIKGGAIVII